MFNCSQLVASLLKCFYSYSCTEFSEPQYLAFDWRYWCVKWFVWFEQGKPVQH